MDIFSVALPISEFEKNDQLVLVRTVVGGHIGFTERWIPTGRTYMNEVFEEFSTAIFSKRCR